MTLGSITESIHLAAFVGVFLVTLVGAFWVAAAKDIIRAAVSLFFCLTGVAGLYFFLDAQFLAVVQIMVYVGGTTVLILFGVMLTNRSPLLKKKQQVDRSFAGLLVAAMVAGPLVGILVWRSVETPDGRRVDAKAANGWFTMQPKAEEIGLVHEGHEHGEHEAHGHDGQGAEAEQASEAPVVGAGNTVSLGDALLTNYLLPFEIASVVLLVALVGASYLARRREDQDGDSGSEQENAGEALV